MAATTEKLSVRSDGPHWEVWRLWVAYTTTGHVVSGILIAVVPGKVPGGFAVALIGVVIGLMILGLLQWLILRHLAYGLRWWSWMLATVVGQLGGTSVVSIAVLGSLATGAFGGLGAHIGGQALQLATKVMSGALLGGVEGFAHWMVLRRYFRAAGWWIVAMISAEVLGAAASLVIIQGAVSERRLIVMMTRLTSGFIVGALTGAVLVWLLRERPKVSSSGLAAAARP
jgi:hypothetical protein